MKQVGLQLYTVRDQMSDPKNIPDVFQKIAAMGYTQAQTAGDFHDVEAFAKAAKDAGVKIVGTHYSWDKIRNDIEGTVRVHEILGTKNVGIGGMPLEPRTDFDALMAFIDECNRVAAALKPYGCTFTYHNHSFEFVKIKDNKTVMDYLIEGFGDNITFVLDTYWVQHGGADIRRMIERLSGRIEIMHLKDMAAVDPNTKAPYITDVGSGNIDMKDIVATAEQHGVKYFVVEQDGNYEVDSMTSAEKSCRYLLDNVCEK